MTCESALLGTMLPRLLLLGAPLLAAGSRIRLTNEAGDCAIENTDGTLTTSCELTSSGCDCAALSEKVASLEAQVQTLMNHAGFRPSPPPTAPPPPAPEQIDASDIVAESLDLADAGLAKGYSGGFYHAGHIYLAPDSRDLGGKAVRISTTDYSPSGVTITQFPSGLLTYKGAFTDGTYAYYVPFEAEGPVQMGKTVRP